MLPPRSTNTRATAGIRVRRSVEFGRSPTYAPWVSRSLKSSEISEAISDLLPRLRAALGASAMTSDVVLTYAGAADGTSLIVSAGVPFSGDADGAPELTVVEVAGSERGVTVRFDVPPGDIGDAWISLDTSLEAYEFETTGVHRQTLTVDGGVVLQASVSDRTTASEKTPI